MLFLKHQMPIHATPAKVFAGVATERGSERAAKHCEPVNLTSPSAVPLVQGETG